MVTNLSKIGFPVIVLLVRKYSSYNHVAVVWKKKIIDIEHEYPLELTVDNVDTLAKKNPYHKLVCVVSILPSRAMKKKNSDYSDWGEEKSRGILRHLFRQCD